MAIQHGALVGLAQRFCFYNVRGFAQRVASPVACWHFGSYAQRVRTVRYQASCDAQ